MDTKLSEHIKGRGSQTNPHNHFTENQYVQEYTEGIDCWEEEHNRTIYIPSHAKSLVNKVDSPDVGLLYSANPYQGCEHGCIYCYARNSHTYWGYSAGLDFERKILIKTHAPQLFKQFINHKDWSHQPISLSGNTDCYQPIERKHQLTRQILKIALEHKQPISIITKNSLVLRDIDILQEMAKHNLCKVHVSITTLDEKLRRNLEPRTATSKQRLMVIENLCEAKIPVGIMNAPVIPGLNDHEIPKILKTASESGAKWAGYTIVRLNGQVGTIFKDWLQKTYPDRADKVWHSIQSCHRGQVNNSEYGNRMKGTGHIAKIIKDSFALHCRLNGLNKESFIFNTTSFSSPNGIQTSLF